MRLIRDTTLQYLWSRVYVGAWALCCFHSLISTQTFRRGWPRRWTAARRYWVPLQCCNQIWQSLEEGAGKRWSVCGWALHAVTGFTFRHWHQHKKLFCVVNISIDVRSVYFNHPSLGNSTNYYIILGPRALAAPHTSQQINKLLPKRVKYLAIPSSIFLSSFLINRRALHSQPIRGNVRRIWRIFPEHVKRSFLDPEYSFVAVGRILGNIFSKQKFAQLRTSCICRILTTMFANKCSPNWERAYGKLRQLHVIYNYVSSYTTQDEQS